LGELVRAYYIGEREKVSASASLATILLERVFDGLALLLFLAVAAIFLPGVVGVDVLGKAGGAISLLVAVLLAVLFVAVIGVLTLIAFWPAFSSVLSRWVARLAPRRVRPQAQGLVERFLGGLAALRSPRRQFAILALSLPVWLFEGAMYLVVSYSFGLQNELSSWAASGLLSGPPSNLWCWSVSAKTWRRPTPWRCTWSCWCP
jgi:uncharacterized protein (TIRG00374 family)